MTDNNVNIKAALNLGAALALCNEYDGRFPRGAGKECRALEARLLLCKTLSLGVNYSLRFLPPGPLLDAAERVRDLYNEVCIMIEDRLPPGRIRAVEHELEAAIDRLLDVRECRPVAPRWQPARLTAGHA